MKILVTGDIHLTNKTPRNRIDDYPKVQEDKLKRVFKIARKKKVDLIIIAGDLFDEPTSPHSLEEKYISLFKDREFRNTICTIFGQHDLKNHSLKRRLDSPVSVLAASGCLYILDDPFNYNNSLIYPCHWGQEIPKIHSNKSTNILVIHKLITKSGPLWKGQKGYVSAKSLLKSTEFDFILSGDNHQSFIVWEGNKALINPGSLMRMTSTQMEHEPSVYILDTVLKSVKRIRLKVKPSGLVFNLDQIEKDKEKKRNDKLLEFVDLIKNKKKMTGFTQNLQMLKEQTSKKVRYEIEEIMEGL